MGKSKSEIEYAIKKTVLLIDVESWQELEYINQYATYRVAPGYKVDVSLRINPDIIVEGINEKIITAGEDSKFGINPNELLYKDFTELKNVNIKGLSIHVGSNVKDIHTFYKAFSSLHGFFARLKGAKGFNIEYINLGGGISHEVNELFLDQYAKIIKKLFSEYKIIIEPGRFIIANAGALITSVLYRKNDNILITDASMSQMIRTAM